MQTATEQLHLEPAPGALQIIQDLLNTISSGRTVRRSDLLDNAVDANRWLEAVWPQAVGDVDVPRLDVDDLEPLRQLRQAIGSMLARDRGATFDERGTAQSARVRLELTPQGVDVQPVGSGNRAVAGRVLGALLEAQTRDELRRLKVCPNDWCHVSFYDRSRNNSAIWHNSTTCGNIANVRASRARKKDQDYARLSAN
jgi:hypothetical protein